jgi:hypothetical protein
MVMARVFEDAPAVRNRTPAWLSIIGPSGTGKTFSALRLATGMQRVFGGDNWLIDTEAGRSLHYAPQKGEQADPARGTFNFRRLPFAPPFGPLDYLEAIEHCYAKGARQIIIDSMSHEHESVGGVMEIHEAELTRLAGDNYQKRKNCQMLAWQKPKSMRLRLITRMLQMECNFILCFRAKTKVKFVKGEEPIELGWQPIAGTEFRYEFLQSFLLLPGARGAPTLQSEYEAEAEIIKVPGMFRDLWRGEPQQLSEDIGEAVARWCEGRGGVGDKARDVAVADLLKSYAACPDEATLRSLDQTRGQIWGKASREEKATLKAAADDAAARIKQGAGQAEPQ